MIREIETCIRPWFSFGNKIYPGECVISSRITLPTLLDCACSDWWIIVWVLVSTITQGFQISAETEPLSWSMSISWWNSSWFSGKRVVFCTEWYGLWICEITMPKISVSSFVLKSFGSLRCGYLSIKHRSRCFTSQIVLCSNLWIKRFGFGANVLSLSVADA